MSVDTNKNKSQIVIAASFTADYLLDPLRFLLKDMGLDIDVKIAPYNQLFQLLLCEGSQLYENESAINIILVRLEDIISFSKLLKNENISEKEDILSRNLVMELPNKMRVAHINDYETLYLYDEIFNRNDYLQNGISIADGDVIFDIGANIGIFSLFASIQANDVRIFSFEPSPIAFNALEENLTLYSPESRAFNVGIGKENTEKVFTYYPKSTVFSGFYSDLEQDQNAIRKSIKNQFSSKNLSVSEKEIDEYVESLLQNRLKSEKYSCKIVTISSVIEREGIDRIDLLKIDAEKSEQDVLSGIKEQDWSKIGQIIMEVHDKVGVQLKDIESLLLRRGFEVFIDEQQELKDTGLYTLWAINTQYSFASKHDHSVSRNQNTSEFFEAFQTFISKRNSRAIVVFSPSSPDRNLHKLKDVLKSSLGELPSTVVIDLDNIDLTNDFYDLTAEQMGNIPYKKEFFAQLAVKLSKQIYRFVNPEKKVLLLDCDNTLWTGICGEDSLQKIQMSHEQLEFQDFAIALHDRGILLGLVSKNIQEDVMRVFDSHPLIKLKWDHIISAKINWKSKSENIKEIAFELNLGMDSIVFVDDNPVECAEVRSQCPQVLTLCLENTTYTGIMENIWDLEQKTLLDEDIKRVQMYKENVQRTIMEKKYLTFKEFYERLDLKIQCKAYDESDIKRIAQLTVRTNQFNASLIRRTESEMIALLKSPQTYCFTTRVSDKFGDYGLVGVIIAQDIDQSLLIDTLLLSCRVLGRGVEHQMISHIARYALERNLDIIKVPFKRTDRNSPVYNFLSSLEYESCENISDSMTFEFKTSALVNVKFDTDEKSEHSKEEDTSNEKNQIQMDGVIRSNIFLENLVKNKYTVENLLPMVGLSLLSKPKNDLHFSQLENVKNGRRFLECDFISNLLKKVFSTITSISIKDFNNKTHLSEIGVNSFQNIEIISALEKIFGQLPKTLLFEYLTIEQLSNYFFEYHHDKITSLVGTQEKIPDTSGDSSVFPPKSSPLSSPANPSVIIKQKPMDIAVIGISGRYPLAGDLHEFWNNLVDGRDCMRDVDERWDFHPLFDRRNGLKGSYTLKGGFIDGIYAFDPFFFNIAPAQAEKMDPQQRLFLEVAWETLEDGSFVKTRYNSDVGVFVGVMTNTYSLVGLESVLNGLQEEYPDYDHYEIPNRVSYTFGFDGPSMAIDTGCSSSLTAIHLACESLKKGECSAALAGGINLILHPARYVQYCSKNMLSRDGISKAFGEDANGFSDGEGVGCLLLKPLEKAIEERNHIYGIIKGSSIMGSGRTSGFMVPNPYAQSSLITKAMESAGVNPRSISYVEAHGTGTALGDPIEIRGLTSAFARYTKDLEFCAIGSVKSNIGHLEAAAGVAGITKILLQLENQTLVPSLHAQKGNEKIDFSTTPFVVQQKCTPWNRPKIDVDGTLKEAPRIASVSSFGAGGSNACVIVQEYIHPPMETEPYSTPNDAVAIILSAKTELHLLKKAENLCIYLKNHREVHLHDLGFTLQVGRQAMEHRLAFVAFSIDEVIHYLTAFYTKDKNTYTLYHGNIQKESEELFSLFSNDEVLLLLRTWMRNREYAKLLPFWIKGLQIDWSEIYTTDKPQLLSLPGYPFDHGDYCVRKASSESSLAFISHMKMETLHPLIHKNISDFSVQRYSSFFSMDNRPFTESKDGKVNGEFPGTLFIEMVYAALTLALSGSLICEESPCVQFVDMSWNTNALSGNNNISIYTELTPGDNGWIDFQIGKQLLETSNIGPLCEGVARYIDNCGLQNIEFDSIFKEFKNKEQQTLRFQQKKESSGIRFGMQCVTALYTEPARVLARIEPDFSSPEISQYFLHPEILLSILPLAQYLDGDLSIENDHLEAWVNNPISIKKIIIAGKCITPVWVYLESGDDGSINFTAFEESGFVFFKIMGLSYQKAAISINEDLHSRPYSTLEQMETTPIMTFQEKWEENNLQGEKSFHLNTLVFFIMGQDHSFTIDELSNLDKNAQFILITCGSFYNKKSRYEYNVDVEKSEDIVKSLKAIHSDFGKIDAIVYDQVCRGLNSVEEYGNVFLFLQSLEKPGFFPKRLLFSMSFSSPLSRCYADAMIGFEQSLRWVLPDTETSIILNNIGSTKNRHDQNNFLEKIYSQLRTDIWESSILWENGKKYIRRMICETGRESKYIGVQAHKNYLITGGGGKLGLITVEHLSQKGPVNLILIGRSLPGEVINKRIQALKKSGNSILYIKADVSDRAQMKKALSEARRKFGPLNGIVHIAGSQKNSSVFLKTKKDIGQVFSAKIEGTLVIDELTQDDPLDFVLYFSSLSAVLGDFGSCDYALANRFLTAYSAYRNTQVDNCQKRGRTYVVNWPIWKDGGMQVGDEEATKMYLKSSGQRMLEASEGVKLLDHILTQEERQHVIIAGQQSKGIHFLDNKMKKKYVDYSSAAIKAVNHKIVSTNEDMLENYLESDLKKYISELLKISKEKLVNSTNLSDFGFDSITLSGLASILSNHFGIIISPSVFFSHSTIEKLIKFFLTEQREVLQRRYAVQIESPSISVDKTIYTGERENPIQKGPQKRFLRKMVYGSQEYEPIAIIGMSGIFPESRNVNEMWQNLIQNQDVVKEMPMDRFAGLYSESKYRCGCIPGIKEFDPLFFEISPREAASMDPRQRLLLQESWKALEDAGYGPEQLRKNRMGMFVGIEPGHYQNLVKGKTSLISNHDAILSARLAYLLDFKGPVQAINTACSSGLVAAHNACQHLRLGDCDTAIVAGVNVMLSLELFEGMQDAGMLSDKGKSYTFDKRADGIVPGEAVVALVLKRLSKAQADGDPIHAVIIGSGVNYDGKTNGITAPNGEAQTDLIKHVYKQYDINPDDVQYIVTHGTGTKLGDPIEVNALNDAFKTFTKKQNFCALTSNKPNFGHAFSASGLVNLINLIQALRFKTIPASLHCEQENEHLLMEDSPFYINKSNKVWDSPGGKLLVGAVSAFGLSGSNAHMVIQEYQSSSKEQYEKNLKPFFLLALSAKTNAALEKKVSDMITFFQNRKIESEELFSICYTLLVGRHHFNYRMAIVIRDSDDAVCLLKLALNNDPSVNIIRNKVEVNFKGQTILQTFMTDLFENVFSDSKGGEKPRENLMGLAQMYCQGYSPILRNSEGFVRTANLPTYPFLTSEYWVNDANDLANHAQHSDKSTPIHPLLHTKTSATEGQCFISQFTGKEFFFQDHIVNGKQVLPGVAHLEMVRAAFEQEIIRTGNINDDVVMSDVAWLRPIMVGKKTTCISVKIFPSKNGISNFEIYRNVKEEGDSPEIFSQGKVFLRSNHSQTKLDIDSIKNACNQGVLYSKECYQYFENIGISYGESFKGIEKIYLGDEIVLAKIRLSDINEKNHQYVLHPGLLDSALQASIGFTLRSDSQSLLIPFALKEVAISHATRSVMWAIIRVSKSEKIEKAIAALDIDVCDGDGNICVRLKGFSRRFAPEKSEWESTHGVLQCGSNMLLPVWNRISLKLTKKLFDVPGELVIVGGTEKTHSNICQFYPEAKILTIDQNDSLQAIQCLLKPFVSMAHIIWIAPDHQPMKVESESHITDQHQGVYLLFRFIKALLDLGYGAKKLRFSVITILAQSLSKYDPINPTHASLHGLCGSLAKEFPNWEVGVYDLEEKPQWPFKDIFSHTNIQSGELLLHRNTQWHIQELVPIRSFSKNRCGFKKNGVYVVVGGAGGIGEVWTEYVLREYNAFVYWIGRRPMDDVIQKKIDRLSEFGASPVYISADAGNSSSLENAYQKIKIERGNINGIIHSALVLMDQGLFNMSEELFGAVLESKVNISVRMAQVFGKEDLDFVLFFSAFQSFSKARGQSNYAAGCTFQDSYFKLLSKEWSCKVKLINWGFWGSVGIVATEIYRNRMSQMGIGSIEPLQAMESLEMLLSGPIDQAAFIVSNGKAPIKGINTTEYISVQDGILTGRTEGTDRDDESKIRFTINPENSVVVAKLKEESQAFSHEIDGLIVKIIWEHLVSLGMFVGPNTSLEDIKSSHIILHSYSRWLDETVELFIQYGYLRYQKDGNFEILKKAQGIEPAWNQWNQVKIKWFDNVNTKAKIILLDTTLTNLLKILIGKKTATDILFADSSVALVENVYSKNTVSDYYNERLSDGVVQYIKKLIDLDPTQKIRIMELGAGTGGTTALILDKLYCWDTYIDEYCYTDVSKAFLIYAEKKFAQKITGLKYEIFNIDIPFDKLKKDGAHYDIIIAANVIHTTENIRHSIRNIKSLLRKDGVMFLNELYGNNPFLHATFGLLDGWWKYEDAYLRIKGSPALSPDNWTWTLESEGFYQITQISNDSLELGQQLLYAYSDGVARRFLVKSPQKNKNVAGLKQGRESDKGALYTHQQMTDHIEEKYSYHNNDRVRECVINILCDSLKVDRSVIDTSQPFADYGLDSITGVHMVQSLNEQLDIELDTTTLFDYNSVNDLVAFIKNQTKNRSILDPDYENDVKNIGFVGKKMVYSEDTPGHIIDNDPGQKKVYCKQLILKELSNSLNVSESDIDAGQPFSDFGLDSISGVHLVQNLNSILGVDLETTTLFDYSTVDQLTKYILAHFGSAVEKLVIEQTIGNENESLFSKDQSIEHTMSIESSKSDDKKHRNEVKTDKVNKEPIAIIGMSGRFAHCLTLSELWKHLEQGDELIQKVSRWDLNQYFTGESEKQSPFCNYGSFLEDIDRFDAAFFNISGIEAKYMDPQQRIFLQEAWKALEDAGHAGLSIKSQKVGVYVGCGDGDYKDLFRNHTNVPAQSFWGNSGSIIPARIAYYLNLRGPAIAIDTACSSSLVAVHLACQALWTGEIMMGVAGGVFIQSTPELYLGANRAGMLSRSGHCRTFDDEADGFVPGEGVGVIILKRLQDAISEGDNILGVICGSGINQDGTTNGITAPSSNSQERLETDVYDSFSINPEEIQYVEAHGTGTKLGDPIEFNALTRSFRNYTEKNGYCAIGSIKTNLGHTATASGVAGIIKILLSLKYKKIPPSINFKKGNKDIGFENSPFFVNTKLIDWNPHSNGKRCAAVSSFGFSGTNAHLVIKSAPENIRSHIKRPSYLIALSARNAKQLLNQSKQLLDFCRNNPTTDCGNMSYTLLIGRMHMKNRLTVVVKDIHELITTLEKWIKGDDVKEVKVNEIDENENPCGESTLSYGNNCIESCLSEHSQSKYLEYLHLIADMFMKGYDLSYDKLYANDGYSKISLPTYCFEPESHWVSVEDSVVSKKQGENESIHPFLDKKITTLVGNVFEKELDVDLFYIRDHMNILPGVMHLEMARGAGEEFTKSKVHCMSDVIWQKMVDVREGRKKIYIELEPGREVGTLKFSIKEHPEKTGREVYCKGVLHFKEYPGEMIKWEDRILPIEEIKNRSHCVDSKEQWYDKYHSLNVHGGPSLKAINTVWSNKEEVLMRLQLPKECEYESDSFVLHPSILLSATEGEIHLRVSDSADSVNDFYPPFCLDSLQIFGIIPGDCYAYTHCIENIDSSFDIRKYQIQIADESGVIVAQLENYVVRKSKENDNGFAYTPGFNSFPFLKRKRENNSYDITIDPDGVYFTQHLIHTYPMLPGAVSIAIALEAAFEWTHRPIMKIAKLVWTQSITQGKLPLAINLEQLSEKVSAFEIFSSHTVDNSTCCRGEIITASSSEVVGQQSSYDILEIIGRCPLSMSDVECYNRFEKSGLYYGPVFRVVKKISYSEREALAWLELPDMQEGDFDKCYLNPFILDGALQSVIAISGSKKDEHYLPYSMNEMVIHGAIPKKCLVYSSVPGKQDEKIKKYTIKILDQNGNVVIDIDECTAIKNQEQTRLHFFHFGWQLKTLEQPINNAIDGNQVLLIDGSDSDCLVELPGCWEVRSGQQFVPVGEKEFEADLKDQKSIEQLFNELNNRSVIVKKIVFFGQNINEDHDIGEYSQILQSNFLSLMALTSVLTKTKRILDVIYISRNLLGVDDFVCSAVSGFASTLIQENPMLRMNIIEVDTLDTLEKNTHKNIISNILKNELTYECSGMSIRYKSDGLRLVRNIVEIEPEQIKHSNTHEMSMIRDDGKYVILGGGGDLGLAFAEYFSKKPGITIILIGRSVLNKEKKNLVDKMNQTGVNIRYMRCDISDMNEVSKTFKQIRNSYGMIHGVIQCAGTAHDSFIIHKNVKDAREVLSPKITGTINIDEETKNDDLDFFCLFSSLASVIGNVGQSDYSYANGFLNDFTVIREHKRKRGERSGRTITINWPLWENGRMITSERIKKKMEECGLFPMSLNNGLYIWEKTLSSDFCQMIPLEGVGISVDTFNIFGQKAKILPKKTFTNKVEQEGGDGGRSIDKLEDFLINILSSALQISRSDIRVKDSFNKLGIDSILAMSLIDKLEECFGLLPKTLFFEYQSVRELYGYLIKHKQNEVALLVGQAEDSISENSEGAIHTSTEPVKDSSDKNMGKIFIKEEPSQADVILSDLEVDRMLNSLLGN